MSGRPSQAVRAPGRGMAPACGGAAALSSLSMVLCVWAPRPDRGVGWCSLGRRAAITRLMRSHTIPRWRTDQRRVNRRQCDSVDPASSASILATFRVEPPPWNSEFNQWSTSIVATLAATTLEPRHRTCALFDFRARSAE